jgi:oxygen-independent coproporphyrinogen-3 oxidase
MKPDVVEKYCAPVPRYTSYPTAPHFSPCLSELHYVSWLAALEGGAELSLYVGIPFCHSLCWYCGCNTKATLRYPPIANYLHFLGTEIANVAALLFPEHRVAHIQPLATRLCSERHGGGRLHAARPRLWPGNGERGRAYSG